MLLIIAILAIIFAFIAGICVFIFTNAAKIAGLIALVVFLWIGYNSFMKYENTNPNKIQSSIRSTMCLVFVFRSKFESFFVLF